MLLNVSNPSEAVEAAVGICLIHGEITSPRGQQTYEVMNPTFIIERPWVIPYQVDNRDLKSFIGAVEGLQLVGQTTSPEIVTSGSKVFSNFLDGNIFHGAYGARIYGSLTKVVELLKNDLDSRQAVLTIFDWKQDLGTVSKDIPCTLSLQFFIRKNRLCMRVNMRSNDVWLGLPYDLVQFGALQGAIAKALDIDMGWYAHSVGSLHLYQDNVEKAEQIRSFHDDYEYEPLWSKDTIQDISLTARAILYGWQANLYLPGLTSFEHWLENAIYEARERII